jgi:2-polyprenyl-6-hydroxyphenyl methylase/3-demethylubiquinone-9 3-methyltransferase
MYAQRKTYHKDKLSANRLLKCYELAPPRIRHYLDAEIQFVISNTHGADLVLELGCGYGRVLKAGSPFVSMIVGNDISIDRSAVESSKLYKRFS